MLHDHTGRDLTVKGRQTRASSLILARNLRRMTTNFGLKCLAGDTPVRLGGGFVKPIKEIHSGEEIWTHTGVLATVSRVWESGEKRTVEVRVPGEAVRCTSDHKWWTGDGWVEAGNLSGRYVCLVPRKARNPNGEACWWLGRQKKGRLKYRKRAKNGDRRPVRLDRSFGRFVGLFLAEGSLTGAGITFAFHEDEHHMISHVYSIAERLGVTATTTHTKHVRRVDVHCAALRDLFETRLYQEGKKFIPDSFWETPTHQFPIGVLEGYIEGDGHIHKGRPTIIVGSARKDMLIQLRDMAFSVHHIWGTIYSRGKPHGFSKNVQHMLVWDSYAGEKLRRRYKWTEYKATQKPRMWKIIEGNLCLLKVLSVRPAGVEPVWDMEVAHPDHSFQTISASLKNCLVITQSDQTTAMFRARIEHHLRDLLSNGLDYPIMFRNKDELVVGKQIEARFVFASGEERTTGRSYSANICHASEVAWWRPETASELIGSITPAVPGAPAGWFDMESTPNGAEGLFYEYVQDALSGDPMQPWKVHFYPWWLEPRYRAGVEPGCDLLLDRETLSQLQAEFEPNYRERMLMDQYGLTVDQILWRRWREREMSKTGIPFLQEYVEQITDCFITSGENFFVSPDGAEPLTSYRTQCSDPIDRKDALPYRDSQISFFGPNLQIWEYPDPKASYVGFCDLAEGGSGRDHDYSALVMVNCLTRHHVATLRLKCAPSDFGAMACAVGQFYNTAMIGGERGGYGSAALERLRDLQYPKVYYHADLGSRKSPEPWIHPTQQHRDEILRVFREAVFEHSFLTRDKNLVLEMGTFDWHKVGATRATYKVRARKRKHDDLVIAAAGALYVAQRVFRFASRRSQQPEEIIVGPQGLVLGTRSASSGGPRQPWFR